MEQPEIKKFKFLYNRKPINKKDEPKFPAYLLITFENMNADSDN
jgi:hypothetical protein